MAVSLRTAWRQLRRDRGAALTSILVLALGIGAAVAMFSVLNAVFLRALPYPEPDRLVTITEQSTAFTSPMLFSEASAPDAADWAQRSRSFKALAFYQLGAESAQIAGQAEAVGSASASSGLFTTLAVAPQLGRVFAASDAAAHDHLVILSDAFWRSAAHADPAIVGQLVQVEGVPYRVIGVMPSGFSFPYPGVDIWTLYQPSPPVGMMAGEQRKEQSYSTIARLRSGVTLKQAQLELSTIQARIAQQFSGVPTKVRVVSYRDAVTASVRPALLALTGAVALVWLIACTAVAGLLLTRFAMRRGEFITRLALGATRLRLAAQLMAECALLGAVAAALGSVLAWGAVAALRTYLTSHLPPGTTIHLDAGVLFGLVCLTLLSVLFAGSGPVWLATRAVSPGSVGRQATAGKFQMRLRDALVIAQVALALLLLAGAGLLLRTLFSLRSLPLGFAPNHVITATLKLPPRRYQKQNIRLALDEPLLKRIEALPGVRAAALTTFVPLDEQFLIHMNFNYGTAPGDLDVRFASPAYPVVFQISLVRGRFFTAQLDTPTSPATVVVNQAFANKYFAGRNPIGQHPFANSRYTIVGELADLRDYAVATPPAPALYFSTTQLTPGKGIYSMGSQFAQLALRSPLPLAELAPAVRSALHSVAPDLALGEFATMNQLITRSIGDQIFAARLLGFFALAALAIALAGLYGLLAFAVAHRTREMGIRMALGAERHDIVAMVLGEAAVLLAIGITLGGGLAWASARWLSAYLYGVKPHDPLTLAAAAVLLALAGLWAAYGPARRAGNVSPAIALTAE